MNSKVKKDRKHAKKTILTFTQNILLATGKNNVWIRGLTNSKYLEKESKVHQTMSTDGQSDTHTSVMNTIKLSNCKTKQQK